MRKGGRNDEDEVLVDSILGREEMLFALFASPYQMLVFGQKALQI